MIFRHRRGIALIIVMIVVSGLSIMAFGLAFRARVRIKTFAMNVENAQAYHLAIGGIQKGRVFLADDIVNDDSYIFDLNVAKRIPFSSQMTEQEEEIFSDGRNVELGLQYAVYDESSFININKTNPVNLMKLDQIDETLVSRIVDWIDNDNELSFSESAESDYYLQQNRPYIAKNNEISHLRELLFIKEIETNDYLGRISNVNLENKFDFYGGVYDGDFIGLANLFSVHGEGKINVNTAPAQNLASLPGIDMALAERVVNYRRSISAAEYLSDFEFLDELDLDAIQKDSILNNCNLSSRIFRIYSFGKYNDSYCCLMAIIEYSENELKTLSLERLL